MRPDLLMVYLPGIDCVSHWLWGNLESPELYPEHLRPSPGKREVGADALKTYYEFTDALIGALIDRFGPDDLVQVVSDHGFEGGVIGTGMTGVHETDVAKRGVIFARGRGIPQGVTVEDVTVRDITPSILAWLKLPTASDMDGRPAGLLEVPLEEPIPTYETSPIQRLGDAPSGAEETIMEQLRALGCIE